MVDAEMVFENDVLSYAEAEALADLWNAAYPAMREIATRYIESQRAAIKEKAWEVDPKHPQAEALREFTPGEARFRRRLKQVEDIRLTLGQLDRGTHKLCTCSPGRFTVTGAFMAVRSLIRITSLNSPGQQFIYRLAAALAEAEERVNLSRIAWHKERTEKEK
jgi:hypothetical protein